MLRRRHFPETEASREAERGKEKDEAGGHRGDPQEAFLSILKVKE